MANNEGVDIIIKAQDQYTKTINNITASNELFGKSVKNIEKEIAALQTYMVKLVTSGISPASGAIKLLQTNLDQLKNSLVQTQNATNLLLNKVEIHTLQATFMFCVNVYAMLVNLPF